MDTSNDTNYRKPLQQVVELLRSEYRDLTMIVTYQIGVGVLTLAVPIGVQAIVNTIAFTQLFQPVVFLAIAVLFCQGVAALLRVFQIIAVENVQRRIFTHVGMELAYRLPRMIRNGIVRFPEAVNRFFDVITVQKSIAMIAIEGTALLLQMLIGLVLLAFYHPMLLAFDIVLVIAILFMMFVLGRGALLSSIEESKNKYHVVAWLEEIAGKTITFSSRSARFFALQKANEVIERYLHARDLHFRVVLRQMVGFLSLQAVANAALLVLGVWLVVNNELTIGQLVAAELVVSAVLYSLSRFQKHLTAFYDLVAALDKITLLTDIPLEQSGQEIAPDSQRGISIEVKGLSYQPGFGKKVIGDFSFAIEAGKKVAVHGASGTGKSLLVDILYGLKSPTCGAVLLNGRDMRTLSPELVRERVVLVRGIEVVHGSILKNLKLGGSHASQDRIHQVLREVGLLEAVLALPDGLETVLHEDGAPFSVGQAKLLMLARAIIGEPGLILIDQTFDGLDESLKLTALNVVFSPAAQWTVLITSRHPEIEKRCDAIIDLDTLSVEGAR